MESFTRNIEHCHCIMLLFGLSKSSSEVEFVRPDGAQVARVYPWEQMFLAESAYFPSCINHTRV